MDDNKVGFFELIGSCVQLGLGCAAGVLAFQATMAVVGAIGERVQAAQAVRQADDASNPNHTA